MRDAFDNALADNAYTKIQDPSRSALDWHRFWQAACDRPDGLNTLPAWQLEYAHVLAARRIRFEDIPDLVFAGFAASNAR